MTLESTRNREDFDLPWCRKILSDPTIKPQVCIEALRHDVHSLIDNIAGEQKGTHDLKDENGRALTTNAMFQYTLNSERGLRAQMTFQRICREPDAIFDWEFCFLLSIGDGVDGAAGRAHGGFNSLVLDHVCGHCASHALKNDPNPATATLTTDYKAPVPTPSVLLARGWVIELSGRKVWVRAVMEDGDGKVLAAGKALFIATKKTKL